MTQLLTVAEAAQRLAMKPATVRDWIKLGKINVVKFGSSRSAAVRIPEHEVERLIEAYRRPAWAPKAPAPRRGVA